MTTATQVNLTVKSQVAKLLATENITIEHKRDARTASFDTDKRVLVLPVWEKASDDVYDMLVAHEVAHALHTPKSEIYLPICTEVDPEQPMRFFSYLNVIEDIRIDRKIKESFPGLRRSYNNAGREMHDMDFFDLKGEDIATLPFGDRLNVYAKSGMYGHIDVPFTEDEMELVTAAFSTETFEDAVEVAKRIYTGDKSDQKEPVPSEYHPLGTMKGVEGGENQASGGGASNDDSSEGDSDSSSNESDTDDGVNPNNSLSNSEDSNSQNENPKQMVPSAPSLKTDKNIGKAISGLLGESKYGNEYNYFNYPTMDLGKIIISYSDVYEDLSHLRTMKNFSGNKILSIMQEDNKNVILNLVKQFEQKMAADTLRRTSYAKTGELNMRKIANYKFSDDLFLRNKFVKNGKSHGMVFIMDWSGSMSEYLMETVEQLIVLCMFCRRINIPFEVYAFTNNTQPIRHMCRQGASKYHEPVTIPLAKEYTIKTETDTYGQLRKSVDFHNNLCVTDIGLINFLSSKMTNDQFKNGAEILCQLARNAQWAPPAKYNKTDVVSTDRSWFYELSGTPLNEAIFTAIPIVNAFRANTGCDIVNTVFLTDGEASSVICGHRRGNNIVNLPNREQFVLMSPALAQENKHWYISQIETVQLIRLFRKMTGSNAIGIRIANSRTGNTLISAMSAPADVENRTKCWKNERFFSTGTSQGYDEHFVIAADVSTTTNDDIFDGLARNASMTSITNAFIRGNRKKVTSRTLLNRFTDIISKSINR
jgi:hypothetical protein